MVQQPSICIVAAKDLRRNTRVTRQANALAALNWRVTVAALELPAETVPSVELVRLAKPRPIQAVEGRQAIAGGAPGTAARATAPVKALISSGRRFLAATARTIATPFGHSLNSVLFRNAARNWGAQRRFDVVQAHDSPALRAAQALASTSGAELVYDGVEFVDDRATYRTDLLSRWLRRLESGHEASIIRRAAAHFAIGPSMSEWMASRYQIEQPLVVKNCRNYVSTPGPSKMRIDCDINSGRIVLFMNSLAAGRGAQEFLLATRQLQGNVHAVFLGVNAKSEHLSELRANASSLGLEQRVHFLPPVPPFELIDYISAADVGVIPFRNVHLNHFLSLPNRLLELIMARVPIAASAFPDMRDIIEHYGIGRCFDPEDPTAQAAAIEHLLATASDPAARQAREVAARELSWERESAKYVERVRQTLGG